MVNCVDGFCTKIRPGHLAVNGALKTMFVFHCGKIPAKQVLCNRRSKVSAGRPYAPDTRGVCFQGPSRALWYLRPLPGCGSRAAAGRGMKSGITQVSVLKVHRFSGISGRGRSFALLRCAVFASAEQPPCGLGCRCGQCQPERREKDYLYSSTRRVRCS